MYEINMGKDFQQQNIHRNRSNYKMNIFKVKFNSRRIYKNIVTIILGCMLIPSSFANSILLNQNDKIKIQKYRQANAIPGIAIYVYKDGKEQEYLYGYSSLKNKTLVTDKTLFELGSITKTFTGLVLAKLITTHRVNLDDKIIIKSNPSFRDITLLQLATHSSGLPFNVANLPYNCPNTTKYQGLLTNFLQKDHPLFKPQSKFLYSNIGFSLLGKDLSNREHQTYEHLVQNNVLSPLNMNQTVLTVDGGEYKSYANGYTATGKPARTSEEGLLGASWALKSTLLDMKLYLKAMLTLDNTPTSLLSAIKTAQTGYIQLNIESSYPHQLGLGWSIVPLEAINEKELLVQPSQPKNKIKAHTPVTVTTIANPKYTENALIEKDGATDGFRAYIGMIPSKKIGVVILINKFTPSYNNWKQFGRGLIINND